MELTFLSILLVIPLSCFSLGWWNHFQYLLPFLISRNCITTESVEDMSLWKSHLGIWKLVGGEWQNKMKWMLPMFLILLQHVVFFTTCVKYTVIPSTSKGLKISTRKNLMELSQCYYYQWKFWRCQRNTQCTSEILYPESLVNQYCVVNTVYSKLSKINNELNKLLLWLWNS